MTSCSSWPTTSSSSAGATRSGRGSRRSSRRTSRSRRSRRREIGHARAFYELAAAELGTTADELAFDRDPAEYRSAQLVELRLVPDWARTIARHVLYETADAIRIDDLLESDSVDVAGLARKIESEEAYHRMHAEMWADRLAETDEGREHARARRSRSSGPTRSGSSTGEQRDRFVEAATARHAVLHASGGGAGRARRARRRLGAALGGDDDGAALGAGERVVSVATELTPERVWEALAEIPDPEIPVISLVDLGVVRDVAVDGEHVRIDFTPTFLGCPALEVMERLMADAVRGLGGEPEVVVRSDDPWTTDRITAEGRAEAPRGRLRPARPASGRRPAARRPPPRPVRVPVLRLDADAPGQPLRPDPVPLDPLLRELPPAVRAVQGCLDARPRI